MLSPHTARRIQVLDFRQRLEKIAAKAFDEVCQPSTRGSQSKIRNRITFIYGIDSSPTSIARLGKLVRLGRHIYIKSSDVLHGRLNMVNLPQVIIDEWREVIEELEQLLETPNSVQNVGDAPPNPKDV